MDKIITYYLATKASINNKPVEKEEITSDPLKGTTDVYELMPYYDYVFDLWKKILKTFNFKNYDLPMIERSKLYTIKNQDEDIVKEMITFKLEDQQVCLRPELTPSLVRMITSKRLKTPIRLYNIGKFWRFETTTADRKREFYQLNCDIVGEQSIMAEIELINMLVNIFQNLNLDNNRIIFRISHRRLIEEWLKINLNLSSEKIIEIFHLLDKKNKIDNFEDQLLELILNSADTRKLLEFISTENIDNIDNKNISPSYTKAVSDLKDLFTYAKYCGIDNYLKLDMTTVRGLNYYSGIVFECTEIGGSKSLCGGGRYDGITSTMNCNRDYSFVGCGIGLTPLLNILLKYNLLPQNIIQEENKVEYAIISTCNLMKKTVFDIANKLRKDEKSVLLISTTKLKKAMVEANNSNVKTCIIIAQTEWSQEKLIIKDMISGYQTIMKYDDFMR